MIWIIFPAIRPKVFSVSVNWIKSNMKTFSDTLRFHSVWFEMNSDLSELLTAALAETGLLQLFLQLSLQQHHLLLQLRHKVNVNIWTPPSAALLAHRDKLTCWLFSASVLFDWTSSSSSFSWSRTCKQHQSHTEERDEQLIKLHLIWMKWRWT